MNYGIGNKDVHVIGLAGQEGRAVFEYFLKAGVKNLHGHENAPRKDFKQRFLTYSDAYTSSQKEALLTKILNSSAKLHFGDDYLGGVSDGDQVFVPQSYFRYKENQPLIKRAEEGKIILKQAIQLVFEISPCPIIGVTGTVGKSTVAAAISHILKKAGKKVYFSGNDREDKWDLVALSQMPKEAFTVLEISNRHLMDLKVSPHVGVLNNISPHHLDDHGSFSEYIKVKKRIFSFQKKNDFAVINDELIKKGIVKKNEIKGRLLTFSLNEETDGFVKDKALYLIKGRSKAGIGSISLLALSGEHNLRNFLAASLACFAVGVPPEIIKKALLSFKGLRFRQEYLGEFSGRKVYNDGKSADPAATIEAVKTIPQTCVLLVGGIREGFKKGDFRNLTEEIARKGIGKVVAFGASGKEIYDELKIKMEKEKIFKVNTLEGAVKLAYNISKEGETIVFSPACQSFDQFRDYRQRALEFEKLVSLWEN